TILTMRERVETHANDPDKALHLLQRYASDPLSWHALESPFCHWYAPSGKAFLGYVDTGAAWVAAGPPVGPSEEILPCAREFVRGARNAGRRAIVFGAKREFFVSLGSRPLRIGLRPYWDATRWDHAGHERASLRYQIRRAQRHGIKVRRLLP